MAIIGVALAIIATTSVAGTLAAFNATYTWQSDSAVTGDFGFSDTTYRLSLFGDDGIILPDESGKSVLSGPAFGDVPVTWSFAADNPSGIPVVFYLASADGSVDYSTAFCSGYNFSQLASYYVKGAYGESIPLAEVSGDLTELVSALSVGKTLCWTWPYSVYSDADCTVEVNDGNVQTYKAYCENLCVGAYEFPVAVATALSEHTVGYAAAGNDDEFSVVPCSDKTRLTLEGGLFKAEGVNVPLRTSDGVFYIPATVNDLRMDSALVVFVPTDPYAPVVSNAFTEAEVHFDTLGTYTIANGTATRSDDGTRTAFVVHPSSTGGSRPEISVTVTAVVEG